MRQGRWPPAPLFRGLVFCLLCAAPQLPPNEIDCCLLLVRFVPFSGFQLDAIHSFIGRCLLRLSVEPQFCALFSLGDPKKPLRPPPICERTSELRATIALLRSLMTCCSTTARASTMCWSVGWNDTGRGRGSGRKLRRISGSTLEFSFKCKSFRVKNSDFSDISL